MQSVSVRIFGFTWDRDFVASSISSSLRDRLDDAEATLDAGDTTGAEMLSPRRLIATQAEVDLARVGALINAPSTKPILVVALLGRHYIVDGHHRAAAAVLRGVNIAAVVVV